MAIIQAVLTDSARKYWPWFFGNKYVIDPTTNPGLNKWNPTILSFKVGEGGWDVGGLVPRTPVSNLFRTDGYQDLDAVCDLTRSVGTQRYAVGSRATFEKALTPPDLDTTVDREVTVKCLLDFTDFNNDGAAASPEIWEIAIFSDHPAVTRPTLPTNSGTTTPATVNRLMIAYGTFPKEIKDATKQILHYVRFKF